MRLLGGKVIGESLKDGVNLWTTLYSLVLIYIVIFIQLMVHEAGHLFWKNIGIQVYIFSHW